MGTKTLIRLVIALAVLGGIAAILHFAGSGGAVSEVSSSTTKKKVFEDFPINDVAKVVIKQKDGSITLNKGAKSWEVAEREGYPANVEPIVGLLRKIWDLNIVQPITIGRTQYGRLGLLDPAAADSKAEEAATLLTFQNKEGKDLASLWLGKVYARNEGRPDPFGGGMATTDAGRYVKRGDGNLVYLVGETFSDVKIEAPEWIDKNFFKVEKIKSIEIVSANKADDWKLERAAEADDFTLANAAATEKLDPNKVSSMKAAFANPQLEDVFIGEEKGQQKTDVTTFKIVTFDDFKYEISVGAKNDLNELPLSLKVTAELPKERKPGAEESDEEKKKLDQEFTDRVAALQKKLDAEKKLEGHVFKVRSYIVDSITKKRSELMEEKKAEEGQAQEVAPGVSLPGLPAPAPKVEAPAPAPEKAPEAPKAEAPKAEAPKAEAPKAEAPKAEAPKAEAPAPAAAPANAPEAPQTAAPEAPQTAAPAPAPKPAEAPAPQN
ncbi:MAG: DUF4340 domain-containing protein [Verrucomicrobiales bacterium]|nr:DUF4340 domain-containing protein [Verrucomicrobiales bacterium]